MSDCLLCQEENKKREREEKAMIIVPGHQEVSSLVLFPKENGSCSTVKYPPPQTTKEIHLVPQQVSLWRDENVCFLAYIFCHAF